MTIMVEFTISTERFEFGNYIARGDGLEAELERIIPTRELAVPYVWVTGTAGALDGLVDTLRNSKPVSSVTTLDEFDAEGRGLYQRLYRIEWIISELDIIRGIVETGGAILEGYSQSDYWFLRFRFPNHDHVATFYQFLTDHDVTDFTIERAYQLTCRHDQEFGVDLTPNQRDAIVRAAQEGYFSTPQEVTLSELAEEFAVTQQALSKRIRPAVEKIVLSTLHVPDSTT